MKLSVGLITYNEEKALHRTLQAVKDLADEIVIVDNGSTDNTLAIAQSFGARVYVEEWKGFGPQKNSVIEKCKGEWILLIDADEAISPQLQQTIRTIITQPITYDVYKIRFRTVCFGKEIKHGGWSNFYRIRLFKRGAGKYDQLQVHENFITNRTVSPIKEVIYHYTYNNIQELVEKFNRYTSDMAAQYKQAGKRKPIWLFYFSAEIAFIKMYIFRLGILDGFEGYLLAKTHALYTFTKYAKLRELYRQERHQNTIS